MTNIIPQHIRAQLSADGTYPHDTRFKVLEMDGGLSVEFTDFRGEQAFYRTATWDDAVRWMALCPPPNGSLRIGSAIKTVTSTLGIHQCSPCAERQLRLNSIKR